MKKVILKITGIFLVSCAVAVSSATAYAAESVQEQAQSVDYESMSFSDLEKMAKKNDVQAMLALGKKNLNSRYYSDAAKWLKKADEKGNNMEARYLYGLLRLKGYGCNRNISDGYKRISSAAFRGNADAMMDMYEFYRDGLTGYEIFLGEEMLSSPKTLVQRDNSQATKWLERAAEAGNKDALSSLIKWTSRDSDKYVELMTRGAEAGLPDALNYFGDYYANMSGDHYDYEKAKDYYTRSNNTYALSRLESQRKDYLEEQAKLEQERKEREELEAKANSNDPEALNSLGLRYEKEKNYAEAAKCYRKAMDMNHAYAMYNLADLYYFGRGVEENNAEAFKLYKKAEANGLSNDPDVLYSLGIMYYNGFGVTANKTLGKSYLTKAADAGSKYAREKLNKLAKEEITTRKSTNYKVLNHSYVGTYSGYKSGVRFDPNGKLVYTVRAMGREQTNTGWWRQNGTEISTSIGTFWLDSNGNLNVYDSDGDRVTWKRTK